MCHISRLARSACSRLWYCACVVTFSSPNHDRCHSFGCCDLSSLAFTDQLFCFGIHFQL